MDYIWSVSGITNYIKEVLTTDPNLNQLLIKGEISNFHAHSSGHMYFTLKDQDSQIKAVMFRGDNRNLKFEPEDGMSVIATGRVSIYSVRGEYQLYVSDLEPDGIGSLHIAFEQLKDKLEQEDLFEEEYKQPIPQIPAKVGVITSPTGAAIQDVISVIKRRFSNLFVLIAPAKVQGKAAEDSLITALEMLNRTDVDVIIIGRGGGSLEDLWAFNKERLARAIFNSETPVISAVGHETDFTIADFVADLRAPTPSAAAELVVSDAKEIKRYLTKLEDNLEQAMENKLNYLTERLTYLKEREVFKLLKQQLQEYLQQIDELELKLKRNISNKVDNKQEKIESIAAQLNSLSPLNTLARGYSLTCKADTKKEVKSVEQIEIGEKVGVRLKDGKLFCQVEEIETLEEIN
ncbi:exodeoxyribonuclease VII large subunit [Natroniella acetigena]|uniref:exodeoxyribonuclease VII large subunit n=1 Tax=Natroniella acetigena TaxID=52004 RepID=UPI00200A817D|nr:exodeoxyribonuclease VII large subunit [Natroniella acetigena]MCK8826623.1 exodeoxyribonuclease VII large subunit [Natroniella acetigena]